MAVWQFRIENKTVTYGKKERRKITLSGCNEPFKSRFWCPKIKWFRKEVCPFTCKRECDNFKSMCGSL